MNAYIYKLGEVIVLGHFLLEVLDRVVSLQDELFVRREETLELGKGVDEQQRVDGTLRLGRARRRHNRLQISRPKREVTVEYIDDVTE